MRRSRQRSLAAAVAAAVLAVSAAAWAVQAVEPFVTASVQVTANPAPVRNHTSPQIARSPRTGELVIVESDVRGDRACKVHISVDDGRTWRPGGELMVQPFTDCAIFAEYGAYATLAFASDGTLYVAFVASEFLDRVRNDTPRHVYLARSGDSGRTFDAARVFEAPDGNPDRGLNKGPMLAVHPSRPEVVYVGWRQGIFAPNAREKLKSNVSVSTDGGRTFSEPFDLTDPRGGDYPALAVGGDGTVHAVYWSRVWPAPPAGTPAPVRPIYYRQSTDRGRTWSPAREIDPGNQRADRPPVMAADPASESVYVTWYAGNEPENQREGYTGDIEVYFLASPDKGATWRPRTVLNDDGREGKRANQYDPAIGVAPDGRVDVAWLDGRLSPLAPVTGVTPAERGLQDVYYSSSSDGGRTFTPNLRVTDRSIDRALGTWENNVGSHYNLGLASAPEAVYIAWQDTRNAVPDRQPEDVYMASVRFAPLPSPLADDGSDGVPGWLLAAAGAALGAGLTMAVVLGRGRRAAAGG
ncbi:MAG: sialidase family protein [Acidimicrobiia bacterium]